MRAIGSKSNTSITALRIGLLFGSSLLLSCSTVEFEQTAERGSLVEYDEPRIPKSYRGLWASPKDACFVTRDYGVQMYVDEGTIGEMAVQRVWGYTDYLDIVVQLDDPDGEPRAFTTMFMQLSLDEQKMRASQTGDREERIYHRCKLK